LDKLNFEAGAPVMKLELVEKFELVGDVSDKFIIAEPFVFA